MNNSDSGREFHTGNRRTGFTLAELLVTIAIIGILAAVSFVAVAQSRKNLKLLEMDNIAREIYVGAQNHLTESKTGGQWDKLIETEKAKESGKFDPAFWGEKIDKPDDGVAAAAGEHDYRRIVVNAGTADSGSGVLSVFLPLGSIDDTVRTGGSYAVEYDILTAQIYSVFYTDTAPALTSTDIGTLYSNSIKEGKKDYRKAYKASGASGQAVPVGYYGGAAVANDDSSSGKTTDPEKLKAITAQILNESRLLLVIDNPNATTVTSSLTITLHDASSGTSYDLSKESADGTAGTKSIYILDSVISENSQNKHFSRFGLTYGCDVYASVTFTATDSKTGQTQSVSADSNVSNSLFESYSNKNAKVSNGRHLENLSSEISNPSSSGSSNVSDVSKATLTSGIAWNDDYTGATSFFTGLSDEETAYSIASSKRNVLLSDGKTTAEENMFVGIASSTLHDLNGNGKTIANLGMVSGNGSISGKNVGLISKIKFGDSEADKNVSISNLTIANASAQGATEGSSGIVIGSFNHNGVDSSITLTGVTVVDPIVNVAGTANASGMIGYVGQGSVYITGSTISVSGTASAVNSANGHAGGFIGFVEGSDVGNVTFTGDSIVDATSTNTSEQTGSFTVKAAGTGNAGGYIGNVAVTASNASVKMTGCSVGVGTLSVSAGTSVSTSGASAGGIIGQTSAKTNSITNMLISCNEIDVSSLYNSGCAGGMIGKSSGEDTSISTSECIGNKILIGSGANAGGLIGSTDGAKTVSIKCSSVNGGAEGLVSGTAAGASQGGLAGILAASSSIVIEDSYSSISVSSGATSGTAGGIGGLIGTVDGKSSASAGIARCYSAGRTINGAYAAATDGAAANSNVATSDSKSAGGFVGLVQNVASSSSISDSYTTCSVYRAAAGGTSGLGGFVGTVSGSNNVSIVNSYTTALVSQGADSSTTTNAGCFAGYGSSKITASADKNQLNYYLSGINTKITGVSGDDGSGAIATKAFSDNKTSPFYVDAANRKTASPYDSKLEKKYPYKTIAQLTTKTDLSAAQAAIDGTHVGDWPTGSKAETTFEKQFGLIYYEIVKHGDSNSLGYYYHGYAADPQAVNTSSYEFKEVYSEISDGRQNNGKGLLTGHSEYVAESGYLVCIESDLDLSKIAVDTGWNQQTLSSLINNGISRENILVPYNSIADKIGISGYDIYRVNETNESVLNKTSNRKYTFDFTTDYDGYPQKSQWKNCTTFTLNPFFSDMLYPGEHDYGYILGIRSASQLSTLFSTGAASYIGGWTDEAVNTRVEQQLDISYSRDDVTLTAYGEPRDDSAYVSPTLNQLRGTFSSALQSVTPKDYYVLKHITKPLITLNNAGTLKQLHISDLDVTDMSAMVDNDQGVITDITIDVAKSPVFGSTNGNKTIDDIHIGQFILDRKCSKGLLINSSGTGTTLSNITIGSVSVGSVVFGKDGSTAGLVAWLNDGSVLSNLSIGSYSDSLGTVYRGTDWGIVGLSSAAKISNLQITNMSVKGNADNISEAFGVVGYNNNGTVIADSGKGIISAIVFDGLSIGTSLNDRVGIIGLNTGNFSNYTISDSKFVNIAQDGASIIGTNLSNGNGNKVEAILVKNYKTEGNGFTSDNRATISNTAIVNAQVGKTGFASNNFGTISSSTISDTLIGGNGFVDNNLATIKDSSIVNAQIGGNGFAYSSSSAITNCHIYTDKTIYTENGYYHPNSYTQAEGVNDPLYGYNMVTIGLSADQNPYGNNGNSTPQNTVAGFVGKVTSGSITNCSVTGKVFGKSAYGFLGEINGQGVSVSKCYSNTIITAFDSEGVASGFGYSMTGYGSKIVSSHSVGMARNYTYDKVTGTWNRTGNGTGFIHTVNSQNAWQGIMVTDCYSSVWSETTSTYYPFAVNPTYATFNGCYYLNTIAGKEGVQTENKATAATSNVLAAASNLGTTTGTQTVKYGQYNTSSTDLVYPYPVPDASIKQYGDWPHTNLKLSVDESSASQTGGIVGRTEKESDISSIGYRFELPAVFTKVPDDQTKVRLPLFLNLNDQISYNPSGSLDQDDSAVLAKMAYDFGVTSVGIQWTSLGNFGNTESYNNKISGMFYTLNTPRQLNKLPGTYSVQLVLYDAYGEKITTLIADSASIAQPDTVRSAGGYVSETVFRYALSVNTSKECKINYNKDSIANTYYPIDSVITVDNDKQIITANAYYKKYFDSQTSAGKSGDELYSWIEPSGLSYEWHKISPYDGRDTKLSDITQSLSVSEIDIGNKYYCIISGKNNASLVRTTITKTAEVLEEAD